MRILETASAENEGAQESERLGILERMAKSIFERLEALEERIGALEKTKTRAAPRAVPKEIVIPVEINVPELAPEPPLETAAPMPPPTPPAPMMSAPLFAKMWKYLNDKKCIL